MELAVGGAYRIGGPTFISSGAGELQREYVLWIEARIDSPQINQRTDHEASADEKHQCHLTGHKDALSAATRARDGASALTQSSGNAAARSLPGGGQSKDNSGENGDGQRKQQHTRIQPDILGTRQATRHRRQGSGCAN